MHTKSGQCITKSCTRKLFTALVFVHYASLHFFTKTLSVKSSGELGVMYKKELIIKVTFQIASYGMLLVISSVYGFLERPTEMGLAVLAGALGLAFCNIDKISKFKGAGFEAEMHMVQTMIESQTEPTSDQKEEAKKRDDLSENENNILKCLQKPGYTWRYAKTVAGEINQSIDVTENVLNLLMSRGLAKSGSGTNGEIWAITNLGKSVQEQHSIKHA